MFVLHETIEHIRPHGEATHTDHGLVYVVDGWERMIHGGPVTLGTGSVAVMPAGAPHRTVEGSNLEFWLVGFCAACQRLDEGHVLMSPFRRVRRGALPVVSIAKSRRRRVVRLFRELDAELRRDVPEAPELARSLLLLLLGEVVRAMPGGEASTTGGSLVADALEFIQRECLSPISLRDVAAAVHRTPTHVAATVKRETGHSVGTWITAGRVAEAALRLTHTDDSIEQIANHVGWQDTTHFIRQFRKAHGQTPAAWRRDQRSKHR